jgi:hypothetical protein
MFVRENTMVYESGFGAGTIIYPDALLTLAGSIVEGSASLVNKVKGEVSSNSAIPRIKVGIDVSGAGDGMGNCHVDGTP